MQAVAFELGHQQVRMGEDSERSTLTSQDIREYASTGPTTQVKNKQK